MRNLMTAPGIIRLTNIPDEHKDKKCREHGSRTKTYLKQFEAKKLL